MALLNLLPTVVLGTLVVLLAVALSIAGLLVVRRVVPIVELQQHNDVAGFVFAILGVIYAVLLAFVVVVVWEQFNDAQHNVEAEANSLADLFLDAQAYPAQRQEIQRRVQTYARVVMDQEWRRMAWAEASPEAAQALAALWQVALQIEPRTPGESNWHAETLRRLNQVGDYRRSRLLASGSSVPGVMWGVLIIGGVITIAYTYLYGVKRVLAQALMTGALAGMIAGVLFLVLAIDHPFSGDVSVTAEAFQRILALPVD